MDYEKVLVTGGAGFIGSHTVDALLEEGSKVWILDNLSTGTVRNLRRWKNNPKFHFRRNTVTRYNVVESLLGRVDAVVHLAAVVSPFISVRKPEISNEVNVSGTLNVLRAGVKTKTARIVFASSSSVYGDQTMLPISESNPLEPITPYGASKLSAEKYCGAFHETYGISTISMRYFNVYGERQSTNPYSGVIAIFANLLSRGRRPTIFGDGEQTRDFIHVSGVVKANLQALKTERGIGDAFNIGTGQATSIKQLFVLLAELMGKSNVLPVQSDERRGDIKHSYANIGKTKDTLRFQSKVDLKQGLKFLVTPHPKEDEEVLQKS
ncbi:MAG TPA: SDR family NAD(P)-dependent oxidoreductase [Candidatus Acidoferrales bacterium]|nr:SDR family NAD(P)-dependent oxidoreductase [Candidatus Acidoferrales bacterium]